MNYARVTSTLAKDNAVFVERSARGFQETGLKDFKYTRDCDRLNCALSPYLKFMC